jgi:hypothetical protein
MKGKKKNTRTSLKKIKHPPFEVTKMGIPYISAMVTSTSTPGSMLMEVICFTTSGELTRSITLLWILNSNLSQVFVPEICSREVQHQTKNNFNNKIVLK